MMVVAGIPLIDSRLAQRVREFAREASPLWLFHHAMRTFLFGSLAGKARGHRFDPEILHTACALHDLGLTPRFEGERPFEIEGAEAARRFLQSEGVGAAIAEVVWDGIALHASPVAEFKSPEIALVSSGANADVAGPDPREISAAELREVVTAFPRCGFKIAFVQICAGVVQSHPGGAARSLMRDIGERLVPSFGPPNFCEVVARAPFSE